MYHLHPTICLLLIHFSYGYAIPTSTTDSGRPAVILPYGEVVGRIVDFPSVDSKFAVRQYLGIPFAQSPPARFKPPEEPVPWNSPWDASYFRNSCIQNFPGAGFEAIFNNPPLPESEDCLYLNIFAPSMNSRKPLPVIFWIHGGSFSLGSARSPDFDGTSIAANHGVIVVTINYRLNGTSALPPEHRNLGFLDQRKALAWVNKHIRAFGGDPSQVTLMGESAGGWAVKELIIHPPSTQSFRAAILQSQAFGPQVNSEASWHDLLAELGCNMSNLPGPQLDCVAQVSVESIRTAIKSRTLVFPPTVDNITLGPSFRDAVRQGRTANIPILIGTNADEGTLLASVMPPADLFLNQLFGNDTRAKHAAKSAYPNNISELEMTSLITRDYLYTCSSSEVARSMVRSGQKVWRYYFNASFPNTQPFVGAKAWHTSEIGLIFGTYPRNNLTTAAQMRLSRTMQQAWADFAKAPQQGPGWAALGTSQTDLRLFDADQAVCGQSVNEAAVDDICIFYEGALSTNGY